MQRVELKAEKRFQRGNAKITTRDLPDLASPLRDYVRFSTFIVSTEPTPRDRHRGSYDF